MTSQIVRFRISVDDLTQLTELLIEGRSFALGEQKYEYDKYIRRLANLLINKAVEGNDDSLITLYSGFLANKTRKDSYVEPTVTHPWEEPVIDDLDNRTRDENGRKLTLPELLALYQEEERSNGKT